jgi:hypothetical protein
VNTFSQKRKEKLMASGRVHKCKTVKGTRHDVGTVDYVVHTIDDDIVEPVKRGSKKVKKDYVYKDGDYSM